MPLGLYVSRCNGQVDKVVDVEAAAAAAGERAEVVRVVDDLFEPAVADRIVRDIGDAELDSVVLAGNSADHYLKSLSGDHLRSRLVFAGLNPNKIVTANILEQVALAHPDDPAGATNKARSIINVACIRAELGEFREGIESEPKRAVLVLGATTEGIVSAQRLLQLGFSVIVADRGAGTSRVAETDSMRATVSYVMGHPAAEFVDHASLVDGQGWVGDYEITLASAAGTATYRVGGMLLADPTDAEWVEELRGHFKVDVDDEGRARSIDPRTHPAETVDPGIMVVPAYAEEGNVKDKIAAADSAAIALVLKLSKPVSVHYRDTSDVDETLCGGCSTCVRTCAFGACYIADDGLSHVDVRRCRGCGKCVVSCPVGARDIVNSPHDYLIEAVRSLAEAETEQEKVIGFLCGGCGYPAGDNAADVVASTGKTYPASFLPVRIPCGGRLDALYVLEAFKSGFDGVAVFRCREGHCHNLIGNVDMDRRINLLRTVLRSRGLDDGRLRVVDISPFEGERFVEQVNDLYESLAGSTSQEKGGPQ